MSSRDLEHWLPGDSKMANELLQAANIAPSIALRGQPTPSIRAATAPAAAAATVTVPATLVPECPLRLSDTMWYAAPEATRNATTTRAPISFVSATETTTGLQQ